MNNDSLPLISIISPSLNQGKYIEDMILSVKNQNYKNIEHIIIDGCSSDNTIKILKKYENTYNMKWISEYDKGQSDAINKGFKLAKGDIVGELDSDDLLFNSYSISNIVNGFQKYHKADIIYGDNIVIDEANNILKVRKTIPWFNYDRLLRSDFIAQPSAYMRKDIIKNNYMDININLPMDYEYWLRIAKNEAQFCHIDYFISAVRRHKSSKSIKKKSELFIKSKEIQIIYGQKFDIKYYIYNTIDNILFLLFKIYGIKSMIEIYNKKQEYPTYYNLKIGKISKLLLNQIFYI